MWLFHQESSCIIIEVSIRATDLLTANARRGTLNAEIFYTPLGIRCFHWMRLPVVVFTQRKSPTNKRPVNAISNQSENGFSTPIRRVLPAAYR